MAYTNSSLVAYTKLSPNHSGQRTHSIDRITPHCVVGQCTAEGLGDWFYKSSTQASSNYGIDKDGRVGLYVEEKNRSWCSSSNANDQRAVTIECASDTSEPYAFRDVVYQKLITLCVDICKRNGKKKLLWLGGKGSTTADKAACENYTPATDEMILTAHRFYANKSCPGNWLYSRLNNLASEVTAQLSGATITTTTKKVTTNSSFPTVPFLVNVIIDDLNIRTSAGMGNNLTGQYTGKGTFTIVEVKDGWGKLKSGAGWIYLENPSYVTIKNSVTTTTTKKVTTTTTKKTTTTTKAVKSSATSEVNPEKIWNYLFAWIGNAFGVAGLMGNLFAESGLVANNLQNTYEKSLGLSDAEYTTKVDNGSYTNFVKDSAGYGLAQWTYYTRKQALLNFANSQNASIGNLDMQLNFLKKEISESYSSLLSTLKNAKSVAEASTAVLTVYERPADQSSTVQTKRAGYGQTYYDKYVKTSTTTTTKKTTTTTKKVTTTTTTKKSSSNVDFSKYVGKISNSGSDENGNYYNGVAGDQTGNEWCIRTWYNRPWTCVLRHPNKEVRELIAELAIEAANNNKIGYDQYQRDTYWQQLQKSGYRPSKITVACEADCSAGVIANVKAVGYLLGLITLKNITATYTGNMRTAFKNAGFEVLTDSKYLTGYDYLVTGDILLNDNHHTATNLGNGSKSGSATTSNNQTTQTNKKVTSTCYANYKDSSIAGTYKTTANLYMRNDAGTDKEALCIIPEGTTVACYGYYNISGGTKWYYIQFTDKSGIQYTGFSSSKYLKKI